VYNSLDELPWLERVRDEVIDGPLQPEDVGRIVDALRQTDNVSVQGAMIALLGQTLAVEHAPLIEPYLYSHDPYLVLEAATALCGWLGYFDRYKEQMLELGVNQHTGVLGAMLRQSILALADTHLLHHDDADVVEMFRTIHRDTNNGIRQRTFAHRVLEFHGYSL
jgi:hypothetical protein